MFWVQYRLLFFSLCIPTVSINKMPSYSTYFIFFTRHRTTTNVSSIYGQRERRPYLWALRAPCQCWAKQSVGCISFPWTHWARCFCALVSEHGRAGSWWRHYSCKETWLRNSSLLLQGEFFQLDWVTSNHATYCLDFSAFTYCSEGWGVEPITWKVWVWEGIQRYAVKLLAQGCFWSLEFGWDHLGIVRGIRRQRRDLNLRQLRLPRSHENIGIGKGDWAELRQGGGKWGWAVTDGKRRELKPKPVICESMAVG